MTISATSIIKKLLVLFLVFAGLYYAQEFLIPLIIGGVLATLFLPLSKWLESKKVPKEVSTEEKKPKSTKALTKVVVKKPAVKKVVVKK